ncbi:MAG TPA: anti-sigma factor antagonist [Lachnospiraceae bacterium]|nr:anti-sigma factor antagonist [Lachnospiraceae bacterium]
MTITKEKDGSKLTVKIEGRLDTTTSPQLEGELKTALDDISELVFDISGLEYISSAGLRVLLTAQKVMNKQGNMTVKGANEAVMEIFEVTGFVDILNIE